jgi:hypothetical protein
LSGSRSRTRAARVAESNLGALVDTPLLLLLLVVDDMIDDDPNAMLVDVMDDAVGGGTVADKRTLFGLATIATFSFSAFAFASFISFALRNAANFSSRVGAIITAGVGAVSSVDDGTHAFSGDNGADAAVAAMASIVDASMVTFSRLDPL